MPTAKVRNLKNKEVGDLELSDAVFGASLNESLRDPTRFRNSNDQRDCNSPCNLRYGQARIRAWTCCRGEASLQREVAGRIRSPRMRRSQ